jgi:two-component system, chemotaxis family, sensor kinase CheA
MNALQEQFIAEARELVHQATDDLMAVERDGASGERIDRIFRAFHTLKGSAGIVELPAMTLTLHAAEDLLTAIHRGRLAVSADIIDRALACLDQVSRWVDAFEADGALPVQAGDDAKAMTARLRDLLSATSPQSDPAAGGLRTAEDGVQAQWVSQLVDASHGRISRHLRQQPGELVAISYEPRADCFFDGDDPIDLMRRIPDLLAFRAEAREAWPPLAALDPFACNLRLQGISAGNRAELSRIFRLVPDQVKIFEIPLGSFSLEPGAPAQGSDAIDLVRAIIEEQRKVLDAGPESDDRSGRIGATARVAANALRHLQRTDLATRVELAEKTATARAEVAPLLAVLAETVAALGPAPGIAERDDAASDRSSAAKVDDFGRSTSHSLRVDEARIDALFNLAGELIVAKNGVAHLARRVEDGIGGNELARALRREHEIIERLATEMHAAILKLRMVSIAQVFRSFPRLVRDMSQRLNKKVALVTHGETTESDKAIVDRLFEPLLHLVRNALDHGVESPQQRLAAGKPETAIVSMQAERAGDRLVVEVRDDGRGIDPKVVRRKAAERGLLAREELDALSDEQALDLIFSAGFSTAAEVSDISGRGVGMDVVRATVEQIGGRVSVNSGVGTGTTVRLDLPVTIAMTRIMVVEAGDQVFGIPMDAVTQTIRLTPDRISQIKNNDGFVHGDRVVPICSLAELMNLPKRQLAPTRDGVRLVVLIETGGRTAAIEVDAIRDRLEVVLKPMQGLLANARGYAGTTLLGNGNVLLVLDIKEVLP